MTAVDLATKTCTKCGETKPLSEFHRNRGTADGYAGWCKPCKTKAVKAAQRRRRQQMGDEAWLAHQAQTLRRWRETNTEGAARERLAREAYQAALAQLRDVHRGQFERLLAVERYERGLS